MREKLLISRCLLGENCKYNGGNNLCKAVEALKERYDLVPVCPECLGGLPIPREPSEIVGDKVLSRTGTDVTAQFQLGAERAVALAQKSGARLALLKERSPSCGFGTVYDGTFSGTVAAGNGIAAAELDKIGIKIYGESRIQALLDRPHPGSL
jgi:uncharacterized protein YbbK (DUF523 family)